jgi:O-succinylhomoserine sulfhydrylase
MLKSLETMPLRIKAQSASAATLADYLAGHKNVERVIYCGRPDHPQAELAKKQMTGGGQMIAFEVVGGKAAAFRVQNALQLIRISNNLGDAKSLVTHPTTTTHFRLTQEQRLELGINDGLIRLSVGLEAAVDLQADLDRALAKV